MEEIIKTLLLEGIDEATIHRVLDVIEEEYEVVDEAGMFTAALSGAVGNERNKQEYNRRLEQFSGKHPKIFKAANRLDNAVGGALQKVQDTGKKIVGKVADKVTNSNDPISKGIRKTKVGQNTLGKVAMNTASQAVQRAHNEVEKGARRPGSAEAKAFSSNNKYPQLIKKRDTALNNAIQTGKQWGRKFDSSNYKK